MRDQADTLRRMMQERRPREERPSSHANPASVFTFSSGKGGVGKSCLVAHLGTLLARSGLRVLMVDGDFGLANLDILLGLQAPAVTLEQVLDGRARLQDAVIGVEPNLWLLPASAGLLEIRDGDSELRNRMLELLEDCPWQMDAILIDVGAGIQSNVLSLHHPAYQSMIVLTPEPTSLTDAYGLIKLARRYSGVTEFSVIVNRVTDGREGLRSFQKLKEVADRFLDVKLEYLGHCQQDEKFVQAVMKRKILLDWDSEARAIPSLELLAKSFKARFQLDTSERPNHEDSETLTGNTAGFWKTVLGETPFGISAQER